MPLNVSCHSERRSKQHRHFDYLVGVGQQRRRQLEAQRLGPFLWPLQISDNSPLL
jgi:hypothetical protein